MKKYLAIMAIFAAIPALAETYTDATNSKEKYFQEAVQKKRKELWGRHKKFIISDKIKSMIEEAEEIREIQKAAAYAKLETFVRNEISTFNDVKNFTSNEYDRMMENAFIRTVEFTPLTPQEIKRRAEKILKELSLGIE